MKLSVCTEPIFKKKPIQDALPTIKEAGFNAFEFWGWWNKDIDSLEKEIKATGLQLVTFCTKATSLVDPAEREGYLQNLETSIAMAKKLGCSMLITQVGKELVSVSREEQKNCLIDGLKLCAPLLEKAGVTLIIEPLNILVDHKGYFLDKSSEAFEIIKAVDSANVKVLFDIYHQQITEGNLISNITNNIDYIAHFHIADVPGRHEPGSGEINYINVLEAIDKTGYKGYIGLEYRPTKEPLESLKEVINLLGKYI